MNILYISSARIPTEKAHGYQTMKMCEALNDRHEVLLLAPARKRVEVPTGAEDIYSYYSVRRRFKIKSLPSLDLPILRKISARLRFLTHVTTHSLLVAIWVVNHKKVFDVVYSRDPVSLFLLRRLSKFRGLLDLPLIHESHVFPGERNARTTLAKELDGLVVVTEGIKEKYVQAGVEEARVLVDPDAVDLEQFDIPQTLEEARKKLGIGVNLKMVSFVGSFHTMGMEKGIPEIIESSKSLLERFSDLYFYFVGGPLDREPGYRRMIDRDNLPQERFVFLKRQPLGDVPLWMKASDILLMPHPRNTFYSFYVSPLKMFEYMASKRPIVASKLPAIEEILADGRNALLGEAGNATAIAENVKALLSDPGIGERLAAQAFRDVQRHTWTKRAHRITEFMSEKCPREAASH